MSDGLCGVCNSEPKKYKCPTCALPYCSIACFKEHKATHAAAAPPPVAPVEPEIPQPPPPAPLPRYLKKKTDFSVLATNPKFQELLKSYPALLPTLQRVYAATIEPDEDDQRRNRGGRGFRGRGARGRGRGGRQDNAPPRWTQKQGDADAMKMLRGYRERGDMDKEKQAVAAFVQLVEETFGHAEY
ncbi:HIT zinc finger [Stagonosporopsis vannaccii]|nr:HIT zinc finger [Stagonosporopsis vannaccii]